MKIFLLHGDNVNKSYGRLMKYTEHAKKRNWDIVHFDGNRSLSMAMGTDSLFGGEKLVIIDSFSYLSKEDLEWMKNKRTDFSGNIVVYHDTVLSAVKIKTLPAIDKAEEFSFPVVLWNMIDSLYPGNSRKFLELFHEVTKTEAVELVISIVSKHIRDLYWILSDESSYVSPPWKKKKMINQAKKFSITKLTQLIFGLSVIDISTKTSDDSLSDLLDLFLIKELQ